MITLNFLLSLCLVWLGCIIFTAIIYAIKSDIKKCKDADVEPESRCCFGHTDNSEPSKRCKKCKKHYLYPENLD